MGEPRVLVPRTPFSFANMGAGGSVFLPIGNPVDTTGYGGGELAVMFYDRLGTSWNADSIASIRLVNVQWSQDAPTMLLSALSATPPAQVLIREDTPAGTLLRCGLSEYNALGAMVQPVLIVDQGATPGDIAATLSVLIDCSGK